MNLLLTSSGRRSYLVEYFKKALGERGKIHVSNSNRLVPSFQYADYSVVTPLIYSDEYIPFLLNYCQKYNIHAVLSLLDLDLPVLANHRNQFESIGVKLLVSDPTVIAICNDKWRSYQFLKEHGFQTPETWLSPGEIGLNERHFPLLIKPRWGMGSLNIFEADNEEELEVLFQKARREILSSPMLKYESAQDSEQCIVIQEKLKGQEYGLDIINDLEGIYQTTIVKKKLAMRAGETDCAQIENIPILQRLGQRLALTLGHIANLDVDVFLSEGKPYVLEMNARFGGGYPFSHLAGIDLPRAIIEWLEKKTPPSDVFNAKIGVIGHKDMKIIDLSSRSN